MAKILSVTEEVVEIGEEGGSLTEVRLSDLSFSPRVGDIVDIFRSENSIRVVLSQNPGKNSEGVSQNGQGININLSQAQNIQAEAPTQVVNVASGKVVNKIAYILCAILLGGLGVHKFMAGKIGSGIVYILFCWTCIPALIGFIEGLVAIGKKADVNGNIVV